MDQLWVYVLVGLVGFVAYRKWQSYKVRKEIPELLQKGAVIVDVRSPSEYAAGHYPGSQNIPLNDLTNRASEIPKEKPVLLCCASGARSGLAVTVLKQKGYGNALNIGSWTNLI